MCGVCVWGVCVCEVKVSVWCVCECVSVRQKFYGVFVCCLCV